MYVLISLGYTPRHGTAGLYDNCAYRMRNGQTVLPKWLQRVHSHQQCLRVGVSFKIVVAAACRMDWRKAREKCRGLHRSGVISVGFKDTQLKVFFLLFMAKRILRDSSLCIVNHIVKLKDSNGEVLLKQICSFQI